MPVHYNVPDTVLQALKEYDMIPALKMLLGEAVRIKMACAHFLDQKSRCTLMGIFGA